MLIIKRNNTIADFHKILHLRRLTCTWALFNYPICNPLGNTEVPLTPYEYFIISLCHLTLLRPVNYHYWVIFYPNNDLLQILSLFLSIFSIQWHVIHIKYQYIVFQQMVLFA